MIEYQKPEIKKGINRIEYRFDTMNLYISAEKIETDSNAELWFYHENGTGRNLLKIARVNLLADRTMKSLAQSLKDNSDDIPWPQVLTSVVKNTIEYQRIGEPGEILTPLTEDVKHPGYMIEPMIIHGLPNIIRGDKGVNKTNLSLLAMGIIEGGYESTPSGLSCKKQAKVGMLDWESSKEMTLYNISRLVEGGSVPLFQLPYLRCRRRLIDEIDRISQWKDENGIEVVLIDSLGQAAGSEKYDSSGKEAALKFFEALNQLNVTSLIIAQNAKSDDNKKSIFGSVYYQYYSRNIFELVNTNSSNDPDELVVALKHTDSNYSKLYDPMGFRIRFTEHSIFIENQIVNLTMLKEKISDSEAILDYMKDAGRMVNVKEIADAIQKKVDQVRVVLSNLKKRGLIVNPESGQWGIAYHLDSEY
jgi:hypothetical protein